MSLIFSNRLFFMQSDLRLRSDTVQKYSHRLRVLLCSGFSDFLGFAFPITNNCLKKKKKNILLKKKCMALNVLLNVPQSAQTGCCVIEVLVVALELSVFQIHEFHLKCTKV